MRILLRGSFVILHFIFHSFIVIIIWRQDLFLQPKLVLNSRSSCLHVSSNDCAPPPLAPVTPKTSDMDIWNVDPKGTVYFRELTQS